MGLLDSLFAQSSYGGQGGGLLDFLRQSQMQQEQYQPSAGFPGQASPIGIGGYQMPRMGEAAQFTPPPQDPGALPPNAQPVQGQLPMQAPQQASFGPQGEGNFTTGMRALGNPGGLINKVADAVQGFSGAPTAANQTAQFLVSKGLDPALAKTVVSDPALLRAVLPQIMGVGGQTDDIKEYQFAKKENPSLTFEKFMQQKKAVSGEYSLTPQYGTNEKGETVLIQTGKSGEAIQTKLPAGVKISSGVEKIDLGTEWGLVDKRTGQMVGKQAKDIEGKESAEERGKAKGLAQVNLPNAISKAEQTLAVIDGMIDHPGRATATGLSGTIDPRNYFGGTDAKNFQVRAKQLEGKAFLEAFESLKGGGAITETEGTKAANAIARLDRSQSDAEYLEALKELRGIVVLGMDRARAKAGQGGAPAASPPAATNLKAKYGLD
jgi:hypothetical protein